MTYFKDTRVRIAVALGAVILVLGGMYLSSKSPTNSSHISLEPSASSTVAPSPGQPGNPGDTAKTALGGPTSKPAAATATATPTASFSIDQFSINETQPGTIHSLTSLSGVTSGTCNLSLVSPNNKTISSNSDITFDGHYNICSLGNISVSEAGTWNATLSVTSSNGATAKRTTTFKATN